MTDVLEQLLMEPEEDEAGWELTWNPAGLHDLPQDPLFTTDAHTAQPEPVSQPQRSQAAEDTGLFDERTLSSLPAGQRRLSNQTGGDSAAVRSEQNAGGTALSRLLTGTQAPQWDLERRLTSLHKAAQRRESRSIRAGGLPGQSTGHDTLLVRGAADQKRHTANYAALVDAVFARDARRYDGPLRLL